METKSETFERQIDELSALKAIFGTDLLDLRQSRCGDGHNKCPIEVQISLKPMVSMSALNEEVYVSLDLYVKCGKKYPNVIPDDINLKNVKGLAATLCQELRDRLYELAKSLRGEVMIFALAEEVRQFLHSNNRPPVKSFYDQMISHKTKLEIQRNLEIEREMETNRKKEEIKRKQLEEELQRKQLALLQESRFRRESHEDIGDPLLNYKLNDSQCYQNHELVSISFDFNGFERRIQRGKCLFHNNLKHSIEYLGIDLSNGQTYVITEWILRLNKFRNYLLDSNDENNVEEVVNHISKIETFFKTKLQSMTHSSLIRYLSMQFSVKSDYIVVDLLQESINGNSLHSLANVMKGQPFNTKLIRHYSKKILEILNFLHKQNCGHGFLKETNIFIDNFTGDLKISGYYLEKQFFDIYCELNSIDLNTRNSLNSTNISRMKMKDIFDFGLLVIAISNDWKFIECLNPNDLKHRIKRSNVCEELQNFIEKCVDSEENGRWSPELLLNHPFILSTNIGDNYSKSVGMKSNASNYNKVEELDEFKNYDKNTQNKVLLNSIVSSSLNSRLMNEFEVLDELGKGGFGYVYKVKNILDGRCYALKKILINPSNHSLYEKIRREVNLLSRLNHENVVRYFTSWIEVEDNVDKDESELSSTKTSDISTQVSSKTDFKPKDIKKDDETDSSSLEDVDFEAEEDIFGTSFLVTIPHKVSNNSSDDQYVIFEGSGDSNDDSKNTQISNNSVKNMNDEKPIRLRKQYMYIQMELCEKSTLRDAIDNGLPGDTHRKRRLFREIVEGLVHIHEQGMIHRDLKPGNVFLDVNDQVKIGDFGLAKEIYFIKEDNHLAEDNSFNETQESDKFRLTGKIGTPFYVAPELTLSADTNSNKIYYTQKVDIYSLGIIFFEMSYPFQTLMERTKVLVKLRQKEIILPKDVEQYFTNSEIELLKSLLQHNYSLRPTSSELLTSECLPAPEMEEKEEHNVIRRAVQNSRTKLHKYMLNELFQKETSEIEDYVFDVDDQQFSSSVQSNNSSFSFYAKQRVFQYVYLTLESIMQSHCGVYLSLPTLVPKHSIQRFAVNDVYYVIDNNGSIVSLPHDLRVPFARYIARNKISYFRRYSIEKVYRQRRVMGYHPKELWECAFDIVTPKQNPSTHILPDTEILSVLCHVINQFPALNSSKLTLKVNHIQLIKAILNYCDISEESHNEVIRRIGECNSIKVTQNLVKHSIDCNVISSNSCLALRILDQRKKILEKCIEESKVNSVLQLLDLEQDSVKKLLSNIKNHMRKKGAKQQNALEVAKKALKELDHILNFAEKLGNLCKYSIRISPSFVMSGSSSIMYSGFIFQLDREIKHKKSSQRQISSVLAVGGRYDELINSFDIIKKNDKRFQPKGAVGLSIEFEKIMKIVSDEENKNKIVFGETIDVVVCSLTNENSDLILKELCSVTKEFWDFGLKVFCFPEDLPKNIDELHAFCLENSVHYSIVLKESSDSNQSNFMSLTAKLFAYEKERSIDKKAGNVSDVVEYVIRSITSMKSESNNFINYGSDQFTITRSDSNKMIGNQLTFSSDPNYSQSSAIASNIRVTFICDRMQGLNKKRYEYNIISHLSNALNFIANNTIIEVIAVDLPFNVLKTISAELEFDGNEGKTNWEKNKFSVMDKHSRHRKHISEVVDAIFDIKIEKKCPILCIISITDNMKFKILG